jgi:hypothetical protein
MSSPLVISAQEMFALAVFCVLEGADSLSDTDEQLKVAAVVVNRTNSANWANQFGRGVMDQMFAVATNKKSGKKQEQFEVQSRFGLDTGDFDSFDEAIQALVDAKKPRLTKEWAKQHLIDFIHAVGDADRYGKAARSVGNSTGFRGVKGKGNVFRREVPNAKWGDDPKVDEKQPSSIIVNWGNERPF